MKYGVNTFIWTANFDRSNLHLLPAIKAAGFDGVEVPLFQPSQFAASDIRKGMADNGLECTICSILTGGMNVISGDSAVREKTRIHLQDCAKAAAEVGAKIIAGPLYSPVGLMTGRRRTDDEWKRAVDCYQASGIGAMQGPALRRVRADRVCVYGSPFLYLTRRGRYGVAG